MTGKLLLVFASLFAQFEPVASPSHGFDEPAVAARELAGDPVANVQIELLPDRESAEQVATKLQLQLARAGLGHRVLIETVAGEPGLPVSHRVVVGPFVEFEDAERARTELEGLGIRSFVREFERIVGC